MRNLKTLIITALLLLLSMTAHGQEQPEPDDQAGPLDQTVPVADEPEAAVDNAAAPADSPPRQVTEEDVLSEFARFRQLLAEENYDEADISAKRVVEMTIRFFGPQSQETAKALNNLAIVQHNNKQFSAAVQNFTSAIEILEIVNDRLNEELVNPLKGLGTAHLGNGRPDLAKRSFDRATHITHVNEGPHNIEQVEILESLAEANVRLGDFEAARDTLDRIHSLNVRHFENDALGLLPSLMRRANWQHRAGYYNDERVTYRRAIRIIESSAGKDDPRLIQPLISLGKSFYFYEPMSDGGRGGVTSTGEIYLKRAVRLAEGAENMPWLELADTRLALADYYMAIDSHNRARRLYLSVWNELSLDADRIEMRNEFLGQPMPIYTAALPRHVGAGDNANPAGGFRTGNIKVDYTVSSRGRVRNIRTEASPVEFTDMQSMVHREIRRRVFRPAIEEGVTVESGNQVFLHEFFYTDAELEELRQEKVAAEQKEDKR